MPSAVPTMIWGGRLLWVSPALPGAVHDLAAARVHGIPEQLARHAVACLADKAYQAVGPTIAVLFKGRHMAANQRAVNRSIAKVRAVGERAATLKTWRILSWLRLPTPRHLDRGRDHRVENAG